MMWRGKMSACVERQNMMRESTGNVMLRGSTYIIQNK